MLDKILGKADDLLSKLPLNGGKFSFGVLLVGVASLFGKQAEANALIALAPLAIDAAGKVIVVVGALHDIVKAALKK